MTVEMPAPLKILHIAETIKGGIASYLNQVVPELNVRQIGGQFAEQHLLVPAADIRYLPAVPPGQMKAFRRTGRGPLQLLRFALAARRAIERIQPDIIFLHSTFAGALVRAQLPIKGIAPKIIYCAHGWAFGTSRWPAINRLIAKVETTLALRTDRIINLSDGETEDCARLGIPRDKMVRVYNGIVTRAPHADAARWPDERLKVLFVGRFDRQKGIDTLLAAAALTPELLSVRCAGDAVVSRGTLGEIPGNVELLGWLSPEQLQAQLLSADIIAMPSRWEGLGIVALEAMRAGKPIVSSDIGGLREVIDEGVTGWRVPPENPAALLAALLKPDEAERRKVGEAGRRRFEQLFSLKQCVDGLHAVLEDLAA